MKNIKIILVIQGIFYIMLPTKAFGDDFDQWKKNGIYIYPQARNHLTSFMKNKGLKNGHLYYLEKPLEAGWKRIKEKVTKDIYEGHLNTFFTPEGREKHFKKNFEVRKRSDHTQLRGLYAKRDLPEKYAIGILNGIIMNTQVTCKLEHPNKKNIEAYNIGHDYVRFLHLQTKLESEYPSYAKTSKYLGGYHASLGTQATWHGTGYLCELEFQIKIMPTIVISPLPGFLSPACLMNNFYGPNENYSDHLKRINVEAVRLWHPPRPPVVFLFTSKKVSSKAELLWDYGGSNYWSNYEKRAKNADTLTDFFLKSEKMQEKQKKPKPCYKSLSELERGILDDQVFFDSSPE